MGKNAQKRRDKRKEERAKAFAEQQRMKAEAPPAAPEETATAPPMWLNETIAADVESASDVISLRQALFHLCLKTSAGDKFDEVAEGIAELMEVDGVVLSHLIGGTDEDADDKEEGAPEAMPQVRLEALGTFQRHASTRGVIFARTDDGMLSRALTHGETIVVEDAPRDAAFIKAYGLGDNVGSLLAVPLRYRGQVIGVLSMTRREVGAFPPIAIDRASHVADQIALDLAQSQLFRESITDPLTGAFGRQALLFLLKREVEVAQRNQEPLSMMLVDIDGLHEFNREFGNELGDQLLTTLAQRLQQIIRGADVCLRFGADEFAILFPRTDLDRARTAAERVRAAFAATPIAVDAARVPSLSFGVALLSDNDDALGLLTRTDTALMAAKAHGGGRLGLAEAEHGVVVVDLDPSDQVDPPASPTP